MVVSFLNDLPDKEQSEGPCEQEGKQSEPLSEEEGKPSKQPSLLEEGKLGFGRHCFCSLCR